MFFFSKKKEGEVVLILDIRSSSIGAGLAYIEEESVEIIYTTRKEMPFDQGQNSESFSKASLKTLSEILNIIQTEGISKLSNYSHIPNNISYAISMYASPWFDAKTKQISLARSKPFKMTEKMFERMVEEEIRQLRTRSVETVTIEKEITNVLINGYRMTNPFNKKVTNLDFSFYVSQMSRVDIRAIEHCIEKVVSVKKIFHKTHPLILFSVIRDVFVASDSFLLVDIGGEVTDIGVAKDDSLASLATIPFGKNHFIREIMKECKVDYYTAQSSFKMFFEGVSHTECTQSIDRIIDSMGKEWRAQLVEGIRDVYPEGDIPKSLFLTSDEDSRNAFNKILNDPEMNNFIGGEESISINMLSSESLNNIFSYSNGTRKDIFIGMAAGYIHIMNNH